MSAVRVSTNTALARITARSACACSPRCWIGNSNRWLVCGQHRQFGCVDLIVLTAALSNHCYPPRVGYDHFQPHCFEVPTESTGECVPASNAIVVSTNDLNPVLRSSRVVASFPSISVAPVQLTMQYRLHRSPMSKPTVNFSSRDHASISFSVAFFSFDALDLVLCFFKAGSFLHLLSALPLGAYRIPPEPATYWTHPISEGFGRSAT